jgi:HSP20 family molecular chaperone IbpA
VHAEYRDGNYERAFTLSDQVDDEHIEAVLKDGVLRLKLPKAAPFAREEDCGAVGVRRKV